MGSRRRELQPASFPPHSRARRASRQGVACFDVRSDRRGPRSPPWRACLRHGSGVLGGLAGVSVDRCPVGSRARRQPWEPSQRGSSRPGTSPSHAANRARHAGARPGGPGRPSDRYGPTGVAAAYPAPRRGRACTVLARRAAAAADSAWRHCSARRSGRRRSREWARTPALASSGPINTCDCAMPPGS